MRGRASVSFTHTLTFFFKSARAMLNLENKILQMLKNQQKSFVKKKTQETYTLKKLNINKKLINM